MHRNNESDSVKLQQQYYTKIAEDYDHQHLPDPEHEFALAWLIGLLEHYRIASILDVGSGTGRVIRHLRNHPLHTKLNVLGVEPVAALREQAYKQGIGKDEIIEGDATSLNFPNESFDLVCEFGALHHMRRPEKAIAEMLRVSRKAIFISDSNIYASGPWLERTVKQTLKTLHLWRIAQFIKTKGKFYKITQGDGLWYPYSVFDNYTQISRVCKHVHVLNTSEQGINPYRRCGHVALLATKTDR
jgi:ubiquinone/menaquinone biosynthesis C-methylase UbiE